jgi:drug/metabolite transporter (DMT)-like permease
VFSYAHIARLSSLQNHQRGGGGAVAAMARGPAWLTVEMMLTFSAWLVLNLALNYYNKWVVSQTNFRFPFLLTTTNKVVGLFVAIMTMYCRQGLPKPQELLEHFMRPLVHAQGVATALNIGLNNWSLLMITLTLNQVIKACVPLPTAALSVIFEGKSFSWQICKRSRLCAHERVERVAERMADVR